MAVPRICSTDGCRNTAFARGLCRKHWQVWRQTADLSTVQNQTAPGEAISFLRNQVLAYEGDDCLKWPYKTNNQGYGYVGVNRKMTSVTRLACEERNGPPPGPGYQAAHSCGKGREGCCNPRHLRWATVLENKADELDHGTRARGERQGHAKLTEDQVREIRLLCQHMPQRKVAKAFGVTQACVSLIHRGINWGHAL